jgi:hypothetical protein
MPKQTPMPDWLKVRIRMSPQMLKDFRKFLKLIHKIEKKHKTSCSSVAEQTTDNR